MNISEFTVDRQVEAVKIGDKEFNVYKTLDADQIRNIIVETVSPLFVSVYKNNSAEVGNIMEVPRKDEKFIAMNQLIYYTIAVVKYATDIEFDTDDTDTLYNIIASNGIFDAVMNVLYSSDGEAVYRMADTIERTIDYRLIQMTKR